MTQWPVLEVIEMVIAGPDRVKFAILSWVNTYDYSASGANLMSTIKSIAIASRAF
jgi:hypothetical protein